MADICKARKDWPNLDGDERIAVIQEIINDKLDEQGLGGDVEVKSYTSPDRELAEWRYSENTVYVDEARTVYSDDFDRVLDTAYHEGVHAAMDKENGEPVDIGDRTAQGMEFELIHADQDPWGFEPGENVPGERHIQEVYRVARQMAEAAIGECKMRDEYGAAKNLAGGGDRGRSVWRPGKLLFGSRRRDVPPQRRRGGGLRSVAALGGIRGEASGLAPHPAAGSSVAALSMGSGRGVPLIDTAPNRDGVTAASRLDRPSLHCARARWERSGRQGRVGWRLRSRTHPGRPRPELG